MTCCLAENIREKEEQRTVLGLLLEEQRRWQREH